MEPISVKQASTSSEKQTHILSDFDFHFKVNKVFASGKVTDDGFLLLKGSQLSLNSSTSMPGKSREIKEQLISSGTLVDKGEHYELLKDKLLSSSSYAASLVAGNSRSGPQSWKTKKGEMLKFIEEKLLTIKS